MSGYKEIDATELNSMIADGRAKLVDVRSDGEVAGGMICGALHIPLAALLTNLHMLNESQPLVFYCHSGMRSAQAAAFASNNGCHEVYNLRGGILAWGKAGYLLLPKS